MREKWTIEQVELLKAEYPDCENAIELVDKLGHSLKSIYNKAVSLKLKRNVNPGNHNLIAFGNTYRFKKGMVPWNKGKKGIQLGGKQTQFQKGQWPHNTKYFGKPHLIIRTSKKTGVVEKFWAIKLNNKKQNYLQYLCERQGINMTGKIPRLKKDVNINKLPVFEDIEIITYAENMERNSIHNYPEEVKKLIRIKTHLSRIIEKCKTQE